jgi:hypothetical protein
LSPQSRWCARIARGLEYLRKFQEMIDEYNSGSANIEELFKKLTAFAQALNEEEKRAILGINLTTWHYNQSIRARRDGK